MTMNDTISDRIPFQLEAVNKAMTELLALVPDCEKPTELLGAQRTCIEAGAARIGVPCEPCEVRDAVFRAANWVQTAGKALARVHRKLQPIDETGL
jgi:hypothetical protein